MEAFIARFEACDPARGVFRSYRLAAGIDLLGDWLVEVTYGRIGSKGRCIRYIATDEEAARKIVSHYLQRRATARKRIGLDYWLRELADLDGWIPA